MKVGDVLVFDQKPSAVWSACHRVQSNTGRRFKTDVLSDGRIRVRRRHVLDDERRAALRPFVEAGRQLRANLRLASHDNPTVTLSATIWLQFLDAFDEETE